MDDESEESRVRNKADLITQDAHRYSYFQLLELMHQLYGDDLEQRPLSDEARRRLRLEVSPSLSFPVADVLSASRLKDDRYRIQASFLGLHGTDSPLPGYYLDQLAYEHAQDVGIRPAYFNFFNHRLHTLLHQGWRKYRYYRRFQPGATDGFSRYIFALIGLEDAELRGATPLPWSRLLSFVGMIASRSRSPGMVAGMIAHCFDLKQVSIREFEKRTVLIPQSQRNRLGTDNCALGENFLVGGSTESRSSKFTIVIANLDQKQFRDLLPSGDNYHRLIKLVDFLLRDVGAYDLELRMRAEEAPPFSLRAAHGTHLGWTSFIADRNDSTPPPVRIMVRA
ncbi:MULTISPECIES: type VI secretion system baseplate subunit TssG [Pseudomonas]|uniref:type VI secretion system baseplate subunit TssG n=2 Tax=Pseudomonas TaxID=286 RepID=UPI000A44B072|nr:type VI secretion system baseplate subunit TssG [Pseudomonas fulva]MBA1209181.1 type VI secretion system baseplate subunit TssG [Pseudomonas fulva]MBA1218636.1 type VI secretion system baseplate subunit TssG [Pseudomonas fulva]MDH0573877.1 type VI secretion system baseplate subunit TssG [Pseudomonas fulva]RRW57663.1 type VI secretion system baseplate subunit TssG [Pseudomonas fulva]